MASEHDDKWFNALRNTATICSPFLGAPPTLLFFGAGCAFWVSLAPWHVIAVYCVATALVFLWVRSPLFEWQHYFYSPPPAITVLSILLLILFASVGAGILLGSGPLVLKSLVSGDPAAGFGSFCIAPVSPEDYPQQPGFPPFDSGRVVSGR